MPRLAHSTGRCFVSPVGANFAGPYAAWPAWPAIPLIEDGLTMHPLPWSAITRRAAQRDVAVDVGRTTRVPRAVAPTSVFQRSSRGQGLGVLLLFGIHMTDHVLATPSHTCARCGQYAAHQVVELVRKFSLFFIPLFRLGSARYVDICTVCGLQTELTPAQAQSAQTYREPVGPQDAPASTPQDR